MFRMFLIISIHSLRMEGDDFRVGEKDLELISIHSLRMEGDKEYDTYKVGTVAFQSTPSAWRETPRNRFFPFLSGISIHSLRMEGDGIARLLLALP